MERGTSLLAMTNPRPSPLKGYLESEEIVDTGMRRILLYVVVHLWVRVKMYGSPGSQRAANIKSS